MVSELSEKINSANGSRQHANNDSVIPINHNLFRPLLMQVENLFLESRLHRRLEIAV